MLFLAAVSMAAPARASITFFVNGLVTTGIDVNPPPLTGYFTTDDAYSKVINFDLTTPSAGPFAGFEYSPATSTVSTLRKDEFAVYSFDNDNQLGLNSSTYLPASKSLISEFSYIEDRTPSNNIFRSIEGVVTSPESARVTVSADDPFVLTSSRTIGSLNGKGQVGLGPNTLVTGVDNTSTTFSGVISGSGGVAKFGTGVFALSGANTYTGATNINAGTLQLGASNVLADASAINVAWGATLDLQANSDTVATLALSGTLAGSGTLNAAIYTLDGANINAIWGQAC